MPSIPSHFTKKRAEKMRAVNREVMRKWRLAHPQEAKERNRRYRVEHKDAWVASYRAAGAKYRAKNPEKYRALKHAECQRNKENKRRYAREHSREAKARSQKWNKANPERLKVHRVNGKARRRLRLQENGIDDCADKILILQQERFCHWCCVTLNNDNREIDHVTPIARGGRHTPDNLVAACGSCNSSKGGKMLSEWTWEAAA